MFKKLLALEPERKEAIINAGLTEFSSKNYDEASTNNIAKNAEMSKALMFHYVHSKRQFFIFLVDYSISIIKEKFLDKIDYNERDLFNRLRESNKFKLKVIKQYPLIFDFMRVALYSKQSQEVAGEVELRKKKVEKEAFQRALYENIDDSKFRKDIGPDKSKEMIYLFLEGYSRKIIDSEKLSIDKMNLEKLFRDFDEYLTHLEKLFYSKL
ncbi:MAG: TetR/AcrR family transcriptional regulator [Nanoarchaeota archaeon]